MSKGNIILEKINEADITYCREALQKAKVRGKEYPQHALWLEDGVWQTQTIDKKGGKGHKNPSLLKGIEWYTSIMEKMQ